MKNSQPRKELRIGLVLYGGVSLAVYIHGVVTEIWHALRASEARARNANAGPSKGTAAVYLELLRDLKKLHRGNDLRIVVDTIAGTSAGGVNGVVLSKAIATGGDASVLDETWIEKSGFGKLKAHPHKHTPCWLRLGDNVAAVWSSGLRKFRRFLDRIPGINWVWARDHIYSLFTSENPKKTPLNGNYFTRMIADTLESMSSPPAGPKLIPPGGRLDLVLTSTDLYGWPRHLPVEPRFHKKLLETQHAHRMRFRFHCPLGQQGNGGDFHDDFDFGLTYAARATAGFPIAFAPVSYCTAARSFKKERFNDPLPDKDAFAARHLPEHRLAGCKASRAWMVDGGILDNKPFSAAIRLIEEKPANRAVYRTLLYIEPDPALVEESKPARSMPLPRAMPGLLFRLFRHEPIFAELRAVASRNRLVQRLVKIANAAETDGKRMMRAALAQHPRDLEKLRAVANDKLRTGNNPSYPGYTVLKARRAADTLAGSISEALGYPYESKHGYFIRQVVRDFFQRQGAFDPPKYHEKDEEAGVYVSNASQLNLLRAFDVPYRLRRLRYLIRVANDRYGDGKQEIDSDEPIDTDRHKALDVFKLALMQAAFAFDELTEWVREHREEVRKYLQQDVDADLDTYIRGYAGERSEVDPGDFLSEVDSADFPSIEVLHQWLKKHFIQTMNDQGEVVRQAILDLPPQLHERLCEAYVVYPMIDAAIFLTMDSAGVRDLSTTRVFRISPHDATKLSCNPRRLKSRELEAFAGFLCEYSREHDLLWGRLDGAERLIDLIIAAGADRLQGQPAKLQPLRVKALNAAFKAILDEAENRPSPRLHGVIGCLRKKLPIT